MSNRRNLIEKMQILHHAKKTGNIAATCRKFNISRISYYHIKNSMHKTLESSSKTSIANKEEYLSAVYAIVMENPSLSCADISSKLRTHGISLSHTSVHYLLKKLELSSNYQRWLHIENELRHKGSVNDQPLNVFQARFLSGYNPCFSVFFIQACKPFEQLNIDVIKIRQYRFAIAIEPLTNFAFVKLVTKAGREEIMVWLDQEVLQTVKKMGFQVTLVQHSKLQIFDPNPDMDSGNTYFVNWLHTNKLQSHPDNNERPYMNGSIQYLADQISDFLATLNGAIDNPTELFRLMQDWVCKYNHSSTNLNFPNYGATPSYMIDYYLKYGTMWKGSRSILRAHPNYILPSSIKGNGRSRRRAFQNFALTSSLVSSRFS